MPPPPAHSPARKLSAKPRSKDEASTMEKSASSRSGGIKSPGAVPGIHNPDSATTAVDHPRPSSSNTYAEGSSRSAGLEPGGTPDLDAVWESIRQQKEKKLRKERSKVQSLEQVADEMASMQIAPAQIYQPSIIEEEEAGVVPQPTPERMPKRRKSMFVHLLRPHGTTSSLITMSCRTSCRESTDGRSIVMVFDMTGVSFISRLKIALVRHN